MCGDEGNPGGDSVLTAEQRRRGMRCAYAGQSVGMIVTQLFFYQAVGTLFIKEMGGSDLQAMLIPGLGGLLRLLELPASLMVPPRRGKAVMLRCWLGFAGSMAVAVILSIVLERGQRSVWVLTAAVLLAMFFRSVAGTFWYPLLHDLVPPRELGRFFGRLRASWNSAVFLSVLVSAWFLGKDPDLWQYQAVIAVATAVYLMRNYFVAKIPEDHASLAGDTEFHDWRGHIRTILGRREVRVFGGYCLLLGVCAGFLTQPVVLYMKHLGFHAGQNVISFGFAPLGTAVALLASGHLVDRLGTKRMLLVAHLLICAICFAVVWIGSLGLSTARWLMPPALAGFGAAVAMWRLTCVAQVFHLAPSRGRAFFMGLASVLLLVGPGVAKLLAGGILDLTSAQWRWQALGMSLDVYQAMFAAAGAALLALVAMLHFVQDVRRQEP